MPNFKLLIAFDGTDFSGWQKQLNAPTVQGELERVLGQITNRPITLHGAGRTDAGVHALGMIASFKIDSSIVLHKLLRSANSLLPSAIRILDIRLAPPEFHARYSTVSKSYIYKIETGRIQTPINRLYAVHIPQKLAINTIQKCLKILVGTHDFASFEASGSRDKSITTGRGSVRTLYQAEIQHTGTDQLQFVFSGDGFLRHMVRNIVGTVLEAGKGRKTEEDFKKILEARDRSVASATAPAHGLFLTTVHYTE